MGKSPRVRFAPSPTGSLHVGGVRTALFNELFARHTGGDFLIRIEDTDRQRNQQDQVEALLGELGWLGLEADEPILWQSERKDQHLQAAQQLVAQGDAYYCFCGAGSDRGHPGRAVGGCPGACREVDRGQEGSLKEMVGVAVRMKVPRNQPVDIQDEVYGERHFPADTIEDFVLVRSDGTPTYNLACVLDDHAMDITHVIRGNDHLSNTPKQVLLYQALGLEVPRFGHLPLILNPDGSKMGKRDQGASLRSWRQQGVLREGMINYLSRLGWSDGTDQEIYTRQELVDKFSLDGVGQQEAAFEGEKLLWMSGEHMDRLPAREVARRLPPWLARGLSLEDMPNLDRLTEAVDLTRERCPTMKVLAQQVAPLFSSEVEYTQKAQDRFWNNPQEALQALGWLEGPLRELEDWSHTAIEDRIRQVARDHDVGAGQVILPLRTALTGLDVGPGIFSMLEVMGKERSLQRIQQAQQYLRRQQLSASRSR